MDVILLNAALESSRSKGRSSAQHLQRSCRWCGADASPPPRARTGGPGGRSRRCSVWPVAPGRSASAGSPPSPPGWLARPCPSSWPDEPAGPRPGPKRRREVRPLRSEHRPVRRRLSDHERRIPVAENLGRSPAEVLQRRHEESERRRSRRGRSQSEAPPSASSEGPRPGRGLRNSAPTVPSAGIGPATPGLGNRCSIH